MSKASAQSKPRATRLRKIGSIADAQARLWRAIRRAEQILIDPNADAELVLRAVHATTQAVGTYGRIIEQVNLAEQVAELQKRLDERGL